MKANLTKSIRRKCIHHDRSSGYLYMYNILYDTPRSSYRDGSRLAHVPTLDNDEPTDVNVVVTPSLTTHHAMKMSILIVK